MTTTQPITSNFFTPDGKRVRLLGFYPRCNKRPAGIRVILVAAKKSKGIKQKDTFYTLENKDFLTQYRRALNALADHHGIPADDPVREAMAATSQEYLKYFGLKTKSITIEVAIQESAADEVN